MAASPSAEMLAAQDAVAISVLNHQNDGDDTTSPMDDASLPPMDDVRDASPTGASALAPVHLLSPRLMRALRQLMNHPGIMNASDGSLSSDSESDDASATGDTAMLCQICLDDVALEETVALTACGHRFCASCFARFLTLKICEGQVHLTCFYEHEQDLHASRSAASTSNVCGSAIERSDVQRIVPPDVFAKFEKFQFNQSHSFARQCPHCDHSVVCEGPEQPACRCENCDRAFCFTHGNAHDATMTCTEYDKRQLRAEKRNRRKIKRISKPCPSCQSPVEKNGGCNHMRCVTCSTDFCWLCGQKVSELISDHYDWTNIRGCAGQQMVHIHGLTTTNKCLLYMARLALYVIVYPIALVLTLVLMLLSCFFALCMVNQDLTFVQVFRWAFRIIAIAGYTAIEFLAVTIVTGLAAGVFGVCWGCHELYKLGKRSVQRCVALRRQQCPIRCTRPCGSRPKTQAQVDVVTTPHVLECTYSRV